MEKTNKLTFVLVRRYQKADYTIGILSLDGARLCNILEPPVNGTHHGVTAIPAGTYEIDLETVSPKFKNRAWAKPYGGKVPTLKDVSGRSRILIHPGTTVNDTDGCLVPGINREVGKVLDSQKTFHSLVSIMLEAKKKNTTSYIRIV